MSFQPVTFAGPLVSSLNLINQVFLRILAGVLQGRAASLCAFGPVSFSCCCLGSSLFCRDQFGEGQGTDAHRDNIS